MTHRRFDNYETTLTTGFVDAGFLDFRSAAPDAEPWAYGREGSRIRRAALTYETWYGSLKEAPANGALICFGGMGRLRELGTDLAFGCGKVTKRWTGNVGDGTGGIAIRAKQLVCTNVYAYPGDSGTGVFHGDTAIGIIATGDGGDSCRSGLTPISRVEQTLDVSIEFAPSAYDAHRALESVA